MSKRDTFIVEGVVTERELRSKYAVFVYERLGRDEVRAAKALGIVRSTLRERLPAELVGPQAEAS